MKFILVQWISVVRNRNKKCGKKIIFEDEINKYIWIFDVKFRVLKNLE